MNCTKGPQQVFWDPGFGLFRARDSGFLKNMGVGFRITFMDLMQDLALLQSGICTKPVVPEFSLLVIQTSVRKRSA